MAPGRVIYLVRHGERIDNVDNSWMKRPENGHYQSDNSPLSARGHKQGAELREWFDKIDTDLLFSSPFDRTLETATLMIGKKRVPLKIEGSFIEILYLCNKPPGLRPLEDLKKTFPLIDRTYDATHNPWKDAYESEARDDQGGMKRVAAALEDIMDKYSDDFVVVSHAATIGNILHALCGKFQYVGQATVTKIVEEPRRKFHVESFSCADHLSDKTNLRPY